MCQSEVYCPGVSALSNVLEAGRKASAKEQRLKCWRGQRKKSQNRLNPADSFHLFSALIINLPRGGGIASRWVVSTPVAGIMAFSGGGGG